MSSKTKTAYYFFIFVLICDAAMTMNHKNVIIRPGASVALSEKWTHELGRLHSPEAPC